MKAERVRHYWALSTLITIAWATFAFGANYRWAYLPLLGSLLCLGIVGILAGRTKLPTSFLVGLTVVGLAITAQLPKVPVAVLETVSPRTIELHRQLDLALAPTAVTSYPISIAPASTEIALIFYIALAIFAVGAARLVTRPESIVLTRGLTILGAIVAFAGIVQHSAYNGKIFGFWELSQGGQPFGPFVNRNHFAGWMLMILPISVGLCATDFARSTRNVRKDFRSRLLSLSSASGNRALLSVFGVFTMLLALTISLSRSGIAIIILTALMASMLIPSGRKTWRFRSLALVIIVTVVVGLWAGPSQIAERFSDAGSRGFAMRVAIWRDAWRVASDFWPVGTGINTFGVSMIHYQTAVPELHVQQAHSDYLQLLTEGGLLVFVPALFAATIFARELNNRLSKRRMFEDYARLSIVASLGAICLQSVVEFSLQIPANAAVFALLLGLAIHDDPVQSGRFSE